MSDDLLHSLSSFQEQEEEKNILNCIDSRSPIPSPQPSSHHFFSNSLSNQPGDVVNLEVDQRTSKNSRRGRRDTEENKNMNRGHWSTEQNKKYHWFLEIHYKHFVNRHLRRMDKIFKTMEQFIGTRQAEQCRSHHQKMQKKYFNFVNIITNLRTQHYSSLDIAAILEDIENAGIPLLQNLATMEQLIDQQASGPTSPELKQRKRSQSFKTQKRQMKQQSEMLAVGQQQKQQQMNYNSMNMLQQSNVQIGDISIYHEKESCLFNNVFQFQ